MRKLKFRGHLNRVLRAGFCALRAKGAVVQVKDRSFLPVDFIHSARGGRAIAGAHPAADAPINVKLHFSAEFLRWR